MKLNPDLIRDILLTVEEHCGFNHYLEIKINKKPFKRLFNYSHEEILYHVEQCKLNDFFSQVHYYDGGECIDIFYLTPKGHEFIENIRNEDNWKQTKQCANKIGSFSLDVLSKIAINVISSLIQSQF